MKLDAVLAGYGHPWLTTLIAALLIVLVVRLLFTAGVTGLRRLARNRAVLTPLLDHILRPARWVVSLLALQFVWSAAPATLLHLDAATRGTGLLLIAALTWLAIRAVAALAAAIVELHPANVSDNLEARRVQTQTHVLARTLMFILGTIGLGAALMTFPAVRQVGASLLASAGVAGLVAGLAAKPVLGNLIAGLQIALAQPIRLDDVVIIQGEWGRIEEITATYVVVKIWDERRLVVPLQWIIENPFQNWTRRGAQLLGSVLLWLDYRVELAPLRAEMERVIKAAPEWDGRVALLQVVDTSERAIQVRILMSAADASKAFDLRCRVREAMVDFLQRAQPDSLPRLRAELGEQPKRPESTTPAPPPRAPGIGDSSAIRHPEHPDDHAPAPPTVADAEAPSPLADTPAKPKPE